MSILGTRVVRKEDPDLLTVGGKYVDDLAPGNALHATFVRASVAHAEIVNIDVSDALELDGVVAVLTAADLGLELQAPSMPMLNQVMTRTWLASDRMRYVGEPLAVILSTSASVGADAADLVVSVIVELRVEEGDQVQKGEIIAMLDSYPVRLADKSRLDAELLNNRKQLQREQKLAKSMASSASKIESLELNVKAAEAAVAAAKAMLNLSLVKAPKDGQILYVHSYPGERVGVEGVVEIGDTSKMYAVAEVYETDIILVKVGQRAQISSPALASPVSGTVESIGMKVGRMDVLGMDPVAEADARVIEVDILLDEADAVRSLTNLQVEVEITP